MGHQNDPKESQFSLVYGTKVVIPCEIQEPILGSDLSQVENDDLRKEDLLFMEEKRENALIRIEAQKQTVQRSYKLVKSKKLQHERLGLKQGSW